MLKNGREITPQNVAIIMLLFLILRDSWRWQPDVGLSIPLAERQGREEAGEWGGQPLGATNGASQSRRVTSPRTPTEPPHPTWDS